MSSRLPKSSPGQYTEEDNGWILSLIYPVNIEFDKSIVKYPNIKRFPGGASNDVVLDLRHPEKPSTYGRLDETDQRQGRWEAKSEQLGYKRAGGLQGTDYIAARREDEVDQ